MPGLAVKYLVKPDAATGRWNIYRGGKPTGSFARDMNTAIGSAQRDASAEMYETDLKATVWLAEPGKRVRQVWP